MPARQQQPYQIITTRMHGIADIVVALALIAAPFVLGFANGGAAQWVPIVLGVMLIGGSLMTRYEFGLYPVIPMPIHLMIDMGAGAFLAASPWIFGFADTVFWPHLIVGLLEIGTALMTRTQPQRASMSMA